MDPIDVLVEESFLEINRLLSNGRLKSALKRCEKLFELYPEHPRVLQGLGVLRYRCGDRAEGEALVRRALEIKNDFADGWFNLGNMMRQSWRLQDAETYLRKALDLDPDHYKALSFLAPTLCKNKQWNEALEYCSKAIGLKPRLPEGYSAMGGVMLEVGKTGDAHRFFRKSLSLRRNNEINSGLLFILNLLPEATQQEIFQESVAWASRYTSPLTRKARLTLNSPRFPRKLRIGYVSGDFKTHPVSYHLRPVLAEYDRDRFEVFLYNSFPMHDDVTLELQALADHYRDISMISDKKAEEVVRNDGIDILVDLAGHTAYHRLTLFARKPAPVQISWLGYFNTTGMDAMDYLLSDPVTIPLGEERFFAEEVLRLPNCRFCYSPPQYAPVVADAPAHKNGFITFGSFNKLSKTNEAVIALWARVLAGVPDAKMLIKWPALDQEKFRSQLAASFAEHGITEDRLILRADSPHPEMLAEYGDVDIALDTFPFTGGATTCEALWMGVPVVTLEKPTPIGRQSKAFLYTIGHPEWVAGTEDEYVAIARALAADTENLRKVRATLREEIADSPLCDGRSFTRSLEGVYERVWQDWCSRRSITEISSKDLRRNSTDELYNLGVISMSDQDHAWAAKLFSAVLGRSPRHLKACNNLGISLFMSGDVNGAFSAFRRAIRIDRSCGESWNNLGRLFLETGQTKKALAACRRAAEIKPDDIDTLINLGIACRDSGALKKATEVFAHVLALEPENVAAMINLALLWSQYGRTDKAVAHLEDALRVDPGNRSCLSTLLFYMHDLPTTTNADILEVAQRFAAVVEPSGTASEPLLVDRRGVRSINVGFVSGDFRHHPGGYLLKSLFEHYDRTRFSFYCYSSSKVSDPLNQWYRRVASAWRDISSDSDSDVVDMIRRDQIDILVDLSGHTFGNRLGVFALRAAPVQISWLGYGHTTGLRAMDYLVADRYFVSPDDEKWFTEKIVHLPHNRFCFYPPAPCPDVLWSPFDDNGFITFGSFSHPSKITPEVIALWSAVLKRIPRSRMILKARPFRDLSVRNRFRQEFKKNGISDRRIELRDSSPYYFMMNEYNDIDIVLDPFPFSGGMTSLEALWMGVPIVTMPGRLPLGRQTASFLPLVDLADLVASDSGNYVDICENLSKNPHRLVEVRETLRETMMKSPLCDGEGHARAVESLFCELLTECQNR